MPLPQRFQEAIDEAAMRIGASDSDDYLAGWRRGDWTAGDGSPGRARGRVAARLDATFSESRLVELLDAIGPR